MFDKLLEQVDPVAYVFDVEDQLQAWQFESVVPDAIALDNFRKLDQAIADRCSVRIDYTTGSSGILTNGRLGGDTFVCAGLGYGSDGAGSAGTSGTAWSGSQGTSRTLRGSCSN